MSSQSADAPPDVFISYSSRDRDRVLPIADRLESAGIRVWIDRSKIPGGTNYGSRIVDGIKNCRVLLLMCSDASLRSKNVKQEIQLAWKYERPYLPLLLEQTSFPEQIEYWLEGWQWVEIMHRPAESWLPEVLQALSACSIKTTSPAPLRRAGLDGLRAIAKFTDQIWPLPAERSQPAGMRMRGLGAPQADVQHGFRVGNRVRLALELDRAGQLLLLDEGPEGLLYCLCPSWFAPQSRLEAGRHEFPQRQSRYDAFEISGRPGREHLLAILSDEPLGFDWMPADPHDPARILTSADTDALLTKLKALPDNRWTALSTFFDVL